MIERAGRVLVAVLPAAVGLVFLPGVDGPFSTPKTALLLLFAGVLGALALFSDSNLPPAARPLWMAWGVWVLVTLLSAAASSLRYLARPEIIWLMAGGVVLWAAAHFVRENRALLPGIAIAGTATALMVLVQLAFRIDLFALWGVESNGVGRMRLYATVGNPDWAAAFIAACAPAGVALASQRRLWVWPLLVLDIAGVIATGSRTGLAALAVGVAVAFTALTSGRRRWLPLGVMLIAAVVLLWRMPSNPRDLPNSMSGRLFVWRTALRDWRPLLGSGPNTFAYLYPMRIALTVTSPEQPDSPFAGNEQHALNDFVEALSETGVLGTLALASVFVAYFFLAGSTLRSGGVETAASLGGVAAILAAACFDSPLRRPETWVMSGLWMAVPVAALARPGKRRWALLRAVAAVALIATASFFATSTLLGGLYTGRGRAAERNRDAALAEAEYRAALRWDGLQPNAHFGLVRALAKQERYADAWRESQELLRYVHEPECRLLRARILLAMEDRAATRVELDAALKLFPYSRPLRDELRRQNADWPPLSGEQQVQSPR